MHYVYLFHVIRPFSGPHTVFLAKHDPPFPVRGDVVVVVGVCVDGMIFHPIFFKMPYDWRGFVLEREVAVLFASSPVRIHASESM